MADRKNSEGYSDPTVFAAERSIEKKQAEKEREIEKKAGRLIGAMKLLCDNSGFEFMSRVNIRHKESGKEFR